MSLKFLLPVLVIGFIVTSCSLNEDWRTARRDSAGIAPDPSTTNEAIIQIYAADTWGWRGWFAVHTWIAAKRSDEDFYTVYDVIGWRRFRDEPVMKVARDIPDRYWYGEKPEVLKDYRGPDANNLIDAIDQAAENYPWKTTYKAFPGPNSNTFVAWIAKEVPELEVQLPFSAIGSGYVE